MSISMVLQKFQPNPLFTSQQMATEHAESVAEKKRTKKKVGKPIGGPVGTGCPNIHLKKSKKKKKKFFFLK